MHTVCHTEAVGKEPLTAGPEPWKADERGKFNKTFPCSPALNGDSRGTSWGIKRLLYSPAGNDTTQNEPEPRESTFHLAERRSQISDGGA